MADADAEGRPGSVKWADGECSVLFPLRNVIVTSKGQLYMWFLPSSFSDDDHPTDPGNTCDTDPFAVEEAPPKGCWYYFTHFLCGECDE